MPAWIPVSAVSLLPKHVRLEPPSHEEREGTDMATTKTGKPDANVCPDCGEPPATSSNGPAGTTAYSCANGHQWDRAEG